MRIVIVFLLIASVSRLEAQEYRIEEIKYKTNCFLFDYYPVTYPQFVLTDSTCDNKINLLIKEKTLDDRLEIYDTIISDTNDEIIFLMKQGGLIGFSYEILFENNGLLSIETDMNISDRADWHIKSQFCIDIELGKVLTIKDIVYDEKLDSLKQILLKNKREWSFFAVKELQDSILNEKDDRVLNIYRRGIDEINGCLDKYYDEIIGFSIKNSSIYFDDGCDLSDAVLNECPFSDYPTKFNPKDVYEGLLKEKYYRLIFEKYE